MALTSSLSSFSAAGFASVAAGVAVVVAAVVVAVVYVVRSLAPPQAPPTQAPPPQQVAALPAPAPESPQDILKRRYAAGEIDREEYLQKLADL